MYRILRTASEFPSELPEFLPAMEPPFIWGPSVSVTFMNSLIAAYSAVVHWRPNLFKVPFGKVGKPFVSELARLFKAFASSSAMESVAMKAAIVLPTLLLQKPSFKSKVKEHSVCLDRRLNTWLNGDLNDLLLEGRTIQQCLPKSQPQNSQKRLD